MAFPRGSGRTCPRFNCPEADIAVFAVSFRAIDRDAPLHELWRGVNGFPGALVEGRVRFGRPMNRTPATADPKQRRPIDLPPETLPVSQSRRGQEIECNSEGTTTDCRTGDQAPVGW
jgi:hypothetical protein